MDEQPHREGRAAQPYVALAGRVPPAGLAGFIDEGFGTVFGWLAERGVPAAGAPFVRYVEVDMTAELAVELGVPVDGEVEGDPAVITGVLPAGDYVTVLHRGPYDGLAGATAELLQWGTERGVGWAMDGAGHWRARFEQYLTDPREEPDPARWETVIALLTDSAG